MAKEEQLLIEGEVIETLPDARFKVRLENGHMLIAYVGGRMRKNNITVLTGDRVRVEVSPYDISKGRIIYREMNHKKSKVDASLITE